MCEEEREEDEIIYYKGQEIGYLRWGDDCKNEMEKRVMQKNGNRDVYAAWKLRTETELNGPALDLLADEIVVEASNDALRGKLREELDSLAQYIRDDVKDLSKNAVEKLVELRRRFNKSYDFMLRLAHEIE